MFARVFDVANSLTILCTVTTSDYDDGDLEGIWPRVYGTCNWCHLANRKIGVLRCCSLAVITFTTVPSTVTPSSVTASTVITIASEAPVTTEPDTAALVVPRLLLSRARIATTRPKLQVSSLVPGHGSICSNCATTHLGIDYIPNVAMIPEHGDPAVHDPVVPILLACAGGCGKTACTSNEEHHNQNITIRWLSNLDLFVFFCLDYRA